MKLQVLALDSRTSILERWAHEEKTLPIYLILDRNSSKKIQDALQNNSTPLLDLSATNILPLIKQKQLFSKIYSSLLRMNLDQLDVQKNIFNVWYAYYTKDISSNQRTFIDEKIKQDLKEAGLNQKFKIDRKTKSLVLIEQERQQIASRNKKRELTQKIFSSLQDNNVQASELKLEKQEFKLILLNEKPNFLDIFNQVILDPELPFITTHRYYKLLQHLIPPDNWIVTGEEQVIIQVSSKKNLSKDLLQPQEYSQVLIYEEEDKLININFSLKHDDLSLTQHQYIERVMNKIFPSQPPRYSIDNYNTSALFYIINQRLDKNIFSDMIMNDFVFSQFFSTDERQKATKNKTYIFLYFEHETVGEVTAYITPQVRDKESLEMKDYPIETPYIRVLITHADNPEAALFFKKILINFIHHYNQEYPRIIRDYKKFLPQIQKVKQTDNKTQLEKINDLFIPNYPTICGFKPKVVHSQLPEGTVVMKFPKSGPDQKEYYCDFKSHPFPNVRKNTLINKDKYPYIPCCSIKDSRQIKGSKYRKYFFDEEKKKGEESSQQSIITSLKILKPGNIGKLPDDISLFLEFSDTKASFQRLGVIKNSSSFLTCILLALGLQQNDLKKERLALATKAYAASCRQEAYDKSSQQLIDIIKDDNQYLDPFLFLHMIELKYKCRIFIFKREGNNTRLTPPPYQHFYLENSIPNDHKVILIYEHKGSKLTESEQPQCELIVKYTKTERAPYYSYTQKETTIINIKKLFNSITKSYQLNQISELIHFPLRDTPFIKLVSQRIDSYGKTRQINIKFENQMFSLLCDPLPPLLLPEEEKNYVNTKSQIKKLLETINVMKIIKKTNQEVIGKIGNVKVKINLEEKKQLSSTMDDFNTKKRNAYALSQHFLWLFSKYVNGKIYKTSMVDLIPEFEKNKIQILPGYNYPLEKISRLSNKNGYFQRGKLILSSEEVRKRLVYLLRLKIERHIDEIIDFKDKIDFAEYQSISDFNKRPGEIILDGYDSFMQWIDHKNKKPSILYSSIQPERLGFYFFQNKLIASYVTKAKNFFSLEEALGKDNEKEEFLLVVYTNSERIKKYKIKGNPNDKSIIIISSKFKNSKIFTRIYKV